MKIYTPTALLNEWQAIWLAKLASQLAKFGHPPRLAKPGYQPWAPCCQTLICPFLCSHAPSQCEKHRRHHRHRGHHLPLLPRSPSPAAAAVVCTVAIHCRRLEASGSTRPRLGGRGDSGSTAWIREEGATSAARPPTSCIFCWRGGFWGSGGLRCLCLCLPGPPSSLPFAAATIAIVCGGEGPTAREAGEERIRVMHPAGSVPSPLDVRCCSRARLTCPPSPWAPTRRRCRSPSPHAHASRRRLARPRLARTQVVVAVAVAVAAPR